MSLYKVTLTYSSEAIDASGFPVAFSCETHYIFIPQGTPLYFETDSSHREACGSPEEYIKRMIETDGDLKNNVNIKVERLGYV